MTFTLNPMFDYSVARAMVVDSLQEPSEAIAKYSLGYYLSKIRAEYQRLQGCKDRSNKDFNRLYDELHQTASTIARKYNIETPFQYKDKNCSDLFFMANRGGRIPHSETIEYAIEYGIATSERLAMLQLEKIGKLGKIPASYNMINIMFLRAIGKYAIQELDCEIDRARGILVHEDHSSAIGMDSYRQLQIAQERLKHVISGYHLISRSEF